MKKEYVIVALIIIALIVIFWFVKCQPTPPPTPTPTKTTVVPTVTFTPTKVEPTPIQTEVVEPTSTPTLEPTKTPTLEPTEVTLIVHTGYEDGWLHFRPGPGRKYLPDWVLGIGAFKENTKLVFVSCPSVTFPWVKIKYQAYSGYVYGEYLNTNPCKK